MNDLIERQAAIETVRKAKSIGQAHRMLVQLPTVDAVEVVRCKDCARFDKKRGCNLVEGLNIAKTNSFCSYGERKDGEQHD